MRLANGKPGSPGFSPTTSPHKTFFAAARACFGVGSRPPRHTIHASKSSTVASSASKSGGKMVGYGKTGRGENSTRKGIFPMKAGEPCKILVGRVKRASMLDCECRKMSVRYKIPFRPGVSELLLEDVPMVFRRADDSHAGLGDPTLHNLYRFLQSEGPIMKSWVCCDPNECIDHRPA